MSDDELAQFHDAQRRRQRKINILLVLVFAMIAMVAVLGGGAFRASQRAECERTGGTFVDRGGGPGARGSRGSRGVCIHRSP